ncbi:AAA family ATPase [Leptolyngbya sp. AN02str]|uniref:AAA family ATPase n=1 Tax=Leptolyngbya sp. AN02str TaxID=3423363 RepID=UPI003D315570
MHWSTTSLADHIRELQVLVLSFHPLIVMETVEEERVQALLQSMTQDMQRWLFEWSITQGLVRSLRSNQAPWVNEAAPASTTKGQTIDKTEDPLALLNHLQETNLKGVFWLKDFAQHLEDATVARKFREVVQLFSQTQSALVLTGSTVLLPPDIAHDAVVYDLKLPGKDELRQVVQEVIRTFRSRNRLKNEPSELEIDTLVQALAGMTLKQARQVIAYSAIVDAQLTVDDVPGILKRKSQIIRESGILDYFPASEVPLKLSGFAGLKQWLDKARMGFSSQAQAYNLRPPKGILILGIQGCGKSLAAKTIAQSWRLPLLKLDAGRLYDKYIGESEKNFRQAVALAESMAPAVLWIDEIEKSFSSNSGDSDGGLSKRMFGFFLTWMQEKSENVFVVATANDISQVPPELFRKGRFDEVFFVDLPDHLERGVILQTHLLQRNQIPQQFDFPTLVAATDGFSGAEIEQAVISALYCALYEGRSLDTELLLHSIKSTVPLSVSRREEVQRLRAIAQERFVSVK